jgi:hypothetical protein
MTRRVSFALVSRITLLPLTLLFTGNQCLAQSLSLFPNTVPADPAVSYTAARTLGVSSGARYPGRSRPSSSIAP